MVEIFPALLILDDPCPLGSAHWGTRLTAAEVRRLAPDTRDPAAAQKWAASRLDGWSQFRQNLMDRAAPNWLPWTVRERTGTYVPDRFGFKPYFATHLSDDERRRRTDAAARDYRNLCRDLQVTPLAERAYRELVADCRAGGIPVAFYVSPEAPLFHSWYTPWARAALSAFVRMLTDELGAPVFDVSGGWAEADFADGHHMFPASAARFSRQFADTHLRPWLAATLPNGRK